MCLLFRLSLSLHSMLLSSLDQIKCLRFSKEKCFKTTRLKLNKIQRYIFKGVFSGVKIDLLGPVGFL